MKQLFLCTTVLAALGACNGGVVSDECDEGLVPNELGECVEQDEPEPGGESDPDAGTDEVSCDPNAVDVIDSEGLDNNCDGVDGVAESNLYVSTTGEDSDPGTRTRPLRTIARALVLSSGAPIFVASGDYEEDLIVTGRVTLIGGFSAESWTRQRGERSTLRVTHEGLELDISEDSVIGGFQIEGTEAPVDALGSDAVALLARGSGSPVLQLWDSEVHAGRAAAGATGNDGEPSEQTGAVGAAGPTCRNGESCTPAAMTAQCLGSPSSRGGSGGVSGVAPTGGGGAEIPVEESGAEGGPGAPAEGVSRLGLISLAGYAPTPPLRAPSGLPGVGGSGRRPGRFGADNTIPATCPAGLESVGATAQVRPPGGGAGGNGGCGGQGGQSGFGGGASIAVIASGVRLKLLDTTLRAATGGQGGQGGQGGAGASGGAGGSGGVGACWLINVGTDVEPLFHAAWVTHGLSGRAGGVGGPGGAGAGGQGGPSVALALIDSSTCGKNVDSVLARGLGGEGGPAADPGGNAGFAAQALNIYPAGETCVSE